MVLLDALEGIRTRDSLCFDFSPQCSATNEATHVTYPSTACSYNQSDFVCPYDKVLIVSGRWNRVDGALHGEFEVQTGRSARPARVYRHDTAHLLYVLFYLGVQTLHCNNLIRE